MRKYLLMLTVVAGLTSCKKDGTTGESSLTGRWEERNVSGGFMGSSKDLVAGNGNIVLLEAGNNFKHYSSNIMDGRGSYQITLSSVDRGYQQGIIKFSDQERTSLFSIKADTLSSAIILQMAFQRGILG